MKARVKSTGKIVEIKNLYDDGTALVNDKYFKVSELDFFSETIDWEQRRYELAKAAMQGFCSNSHEQVMSASLNITAEWSLGFADALIKKLKGE
jgi:hypothetical protein